MSSFNYNAAAFSQAILYAERMETQMEDAKSQALGILGSLNPPPDLDISGEVASLKSQIEALSTRAVEISSTITSLRNQIESTDASISSQIRYYIGNESKYLINNDPDFIYQFSNLSDFFSQDDIQYITKNFKEILYSNTEYGGDQGLPIQDYINGDNTYETIIKNYFPDMSDEEIVDYLIAMNEEGCGYVATANYIFEAYLDKPEQFEKDFGFPMYYKDSDGKIKTTVNYLFTDIYCYANKNDIVDGDNIENLWNIKGRIFDQDDPGYSYKGSSKRNIGTNQNIRNKILDSDRYNNSNIELNIIKEKNSLSTFNFDNLIRAAIDDGKVIELSAYDYTLYQVDENNNRDNSKVPLEYKSASHAMTITDINQNGDYIVSTWGEKYALDPLSLDPQFGIAIVETKGGDDDNE